MVITGAKALRFVVGTALAIGVSQGLMPAANAAVTSFPNRTASFNGEVRSVVYHNGVIYVGGGFTAAIQNGRSIPRNHVAAIDETTGTVLPWNPNTNGEVWALAVTRYRTYIGGGFSRVGGATHSNIASVATAGTGALRPGFTARASAAVKALAVSGSTLYAGGDFRVFNGRSSPFLAALNRRTGARITRFTARPNATVRALVPANGMLYVGGEFSTMNGLRRGRYFAAVNPTSGALQSNWTSPVGYRILNIAATSTQIYGAGDGPGGHLVSANLNGRAQWIVTSDGGFQAVTMLGNRIYAGGHFGNVCSSSRTGDHGVCLDGQVHRQKFAAFNLNGTLRPWAPQANSTLGTFSLDSDPATGRVAAGGQFTKFNFNKISQPFFAQWG